MDQARIAKLLHEIQQRAGGTAGVDAAKAELDIAVGVELGQQLAVLTQGIDDTKRSVQEMTGELAKTREQMRTSSDAASRHQRALVIWTIVLSLATLAYAVAAFLPLFWRPPTASSAATERVWVLWKLFAGDPKTRPQPVLVRAYNTEQDCGRGIGDALDFFARNPNMVVRKGPGYVCLPVAVDPRDLKGK